jgi:hypothetical protein
MTYVCKFHIYRVNNLFARAECSGCTPDVINNPNCPKYAPVSVADFEQLKGRFFTAIKKLDPKKSWRVDHGLHKLEKMVR